MIILTSILPDPLMLNVIAAKFRCSEAYISHAFKKDYRLFTNPVCNSPSNRYGADILISSDYTATQITALVGDDITNYFNMIFTKVVVLPLI